LLSGYLKLHFKRLQHRFARAAVVNGEHNALKAIGKFRLPLYALGTFIGIFGANYMLREHSINTLLISPLIYTALFTWLQSLADKQPPPE